MHMADALISPVVGGCMLLTTITLGAYSIKKLQDQLDDKKVPLMGVMGAFVFAAQMINFTIPGTGSSGHIAGGLLLAVLLGPAAGFLTMASILLIQALFFGDGGLLAYGANVINLGFFACYIAYPLLYKRFTSKGITPQRIFVASLIASVGSLQLGAFAVVLETFFSGKTELPFLTFLILMQPIHLAIGFVEGLLTASVITFIWSVRPEIIEYTSKTQGTKQPSLRHLILILCILFALTAGGLSWFASSNPDGLEWSVLQTTGQEDLESTQSIHKFLAQLQANIVPLPEYQFKRVDQDTALSADEKWPNVDGGTSFSGLVGGLLTFILALSLGWLIKLLQKKNSKKNRVNEVKE